VKGPVNSYSLTWSGALHGLLLLLAVLLPLLPSFRPKELAIPVDFTVVLEENLVEPNRPQPAMKAIIPRHTANNAAIFTRRFPMLFMRRSPFERV